MSANLTSFDETMEFDRTNDSLEVENFETENYRRSDFIWTFFQHGFHHILEKIFLSLPPRSILACQKVSSDWKEMIDFYHNSENPRIKRIHEETLNQEWLQGNPIFESFELPGNAPSCQTFHHFTMDDREVAIVGLFSNNSNDYGQPAIHILDAKTLQFKKLIQVRSYLPEKKLSLRFNLALTEKYIVLTGVEAVGLNSRQYFWAAWHRNNDFAFSGAHARERFLLPLTNWNLGPQGSTTEIVLKPFYEETSWPKHSVNLIAKSSTFLCYKVQIGVEKELFIFSRSDQSTLSFIFGGKEIWVKSKQKQMRLVGYNEEFVCVSWQNESMMENSLEVYQTIDGRMKQSFDLTKEFRSICKAQISHERIAVSGITTGNLRRKFDVFVFDLKTAAKLLQCSSLVDDLTVVEQFVLGKEKIVFLERLSWPEKGTKGKIFSAKFWL